MSDIDRRALLGGMGALSVTMGCNLRVEEADYCLDEDGGGALLTDDGERPDLSECQPEAAQAEGPFHSEGAPNTADLVDDDGVIVFITGRVWEPGCGATIASAEVEFWHTDNSGNYDNSGFRYRTRLVCDDNGEFSLRTIRPGLYADNGVYRPAHYHVKVHVDGVERLTTQYYLEGDPYLACDAIANTSLILPVGGNETDGLELDIDIVLG